MLIALSTPLLEAQAPADRGGRGDLFAGSELENYLRKMQVAGVAGPYPLGIRALSPHELDLILTSDSLHPWAGQYELHARDRSEPRLEWVAPSLSVGINTGFAYGSNDGAIWSGRGLTTAAQAGLAARLGPISLTLAPVAFRAENRSFEMAPNGRSEDHRFVDWRAWPIDLPQRFGDGAYQRIDPGNSTLRIDLAGAALGISTANQIWGPANEYPIILGANAAGIPHLFLGTSSPRDIWIGRAHGRVIWGRLGQSEFSEISGALATRFASGLVAVFQPRGLPGLELGFTRFFHLEWPEDGVGRSEFVYPLQSFFKGRLVDSNPDPDRPFEPERTEADNQLASIFARWVFPRAGFELYGEFGKEDHNYDLRDLIVQPDHNAGYMVGFQKIWSGSFDRWTSFRAELLNLQVNHNLYFRSQSPFYQHAGLNQGHTHRGQLLGAAPGFGGGGAMFALERHGSWGRWSLRGARELQMDNAGLFPSRRVFPDGVDVLYAMGGDATLFTRGLAITTGLVVVRNLNRYHAFDATNLRANVEVRVLP